MDELLKLNLGCGLKTPLDWVNIDTSFTARLMRIEWLYKLVCKIIGTERVPWSKNIKIIDIRKGLPLKNGSAKAIFSSHMLEHMSYKDADFVIRECYRVLCKNGVMRILVPDLYQISKKYIELNDLEPKEEHSHNFLKELGAFDKESSRGIVGLFKKIFSHNKHLYMYDQWSLRKLLEKNGFDKVQRMYYGQSCMEDVNAVEDEWSDHHTLCVEGIKIC